MPRTVFFYISAAFSPASPRSATDQPVSDVRLHFGPPGPAESFVRWAVGRSGDRRAVRKTEQNKEMPTTLLLWQQAKPTEFLACIGAQPSVVVDRRRPVFPLGRAGANVSEHVCLIAVPLGPSAFAVSTAS